VTYSRQTVSLFDVAETLLFWLFVLIAVSGGWYWLTDLEGPGCVLALWPTGSLAQSPEPVLSETEQYFVLVAGLLGPFYLIVGTYFGVRSFGMLPRFAPWRRVSSIQLHPIVRSVVVPGASIPNASRNLRSWRRWGPSLRGLEGYAPVTGGLVRLFTVVAISTYGTFLSYASFGRWAPFG
jgi:hypothetical protein